jgi:serine/threonine-protein kinase
MQPEVRTGSVVAGFRVISLVGQGAMGKVYLAEEIATGRRVALKVLAAELARDERFRQRFLRESQAASSLDHPNIVPTVAAGEEEGVLYLAMAYVEGADLRELLRREGRFDPERALGLVAQAAQALDAAHAAGLVHRDVKPGNVLVSAVDADEHVFVCDFGLARHVSSVSSLTSERGFVGTIDYVPPEQIEGAPIDGRADVYSLGCVLFECLAGAGPFDRESELSVLFAHLNDPPPRLTDLRPELPEAFDTVFATALAKSPDDRYSTCGELVAAAQAALEGKLLARRRRRRRRGFVLVAAVLLAAGAVVGGILATEGAHARNPASHDQIIPLQPSALNLVDARTHRVLKSVGIGNQVPVADTSWDTVFTKRAAWVLIGSQQRLVRVDLRTRKVTEYKAFRNWYAGAITSTPDRVWVAQDSGPELREFDADTGKILHTMTIQGGESDSGIAYGAGSLWLNSGNGVARVDPRTGRITHQFRVAGISSMRIVFADRVVYAARQGNGFVVKIDPVANRMTPATPLHGWVTDLAVGGGSVWVSIVPGGVYRLDAANLAVQQTLSVGADPEQIAFGGHALWITDPSAGNVSRVAQISGAHETFAGRGAQPATAAYHDGLVWVAASPALPPLPPVAGQQLDLVAGSVPLDPAHNGLFDEQVLYATCAKLLNYPDASGAKGAQLQPEIAAAMPTVSRGGRTYTFRIRRGFRFSPPSNEAVTAETFRHTIERQIATTPKNVGLDPYVADVVGAKAFYAGMAPHVSGLTVHGDRLSVTLVKPAGDFLARMAMPRFCPVPLSVPVSGGGNEPIPSAGPYYIASSLGPRSVLLPNPNYHGLRPRRSARIVVQTNVPEAKAVSLTDHGRVDLITASAATDLLTPGGVIDRHARRSSTLARRYALYQAPLFDYFVFNTRRPLFRNPRLRRAVDYALDRRALASAFSDAAADRVVPPAVPGYPAGRIFPLSPDLAAAEKLAGRGKRHAVLYICSDARERSMADTVRRNLAPIGIDVSVLEDAAQCGNPSTSPKIRRADLFLVSGFPTSEADERDPVRFLDNMLQRGAYGTPVPDAGWDERSFRRKLDRARALRGPGRVAALHRLADAFTRTGPIAVFGSWVWPEYFAPQVGCKVFQGQYGFVDLGALCKD